MARASGRADLWVGVGRKVDSKADPAGQEVRATSDRTGAGSKRFGPSFALIFSKWRGDLIGFCSWNDRAAADHIDADWFRCHPDAPKRGR